MVAAKYGHHGSSPGTVRGTNDCLCDRTFVTEVTNLAISGQLYAGAVEKAVIIAVYFGVRIQTCPAQ